MNRRGFLGSLLGAVGGMALDPERALWVPGKKLISIPAPAALSYSRLHSDMLKVLMNKFEFHPHAFAMVYPRIGDTISVRKPARFVVQCP